MQVGQTHKCMGMHCQDIDKRLGPQLELHPTAGQGQTAVKVISCCVECEWA